MVIYSLPMAGKIAYMDFVMAVLATVALEIDSFKGMLWYWYYMIRYSR